MKEEVLVFKKWVIYTLWTVIMLCLLVLGAECEDMSLFISSKIIAMLILTICSKLISKYNRLEWR